MSDNTYTIFNDVPTVKQQIPQKNMFTKAPIDDRIQRRNIYPKSTRSNEREVPYSHPFPQSYAPTYPQSHPETNSCITQDDSCGTQFPIPNTYDPNCSVNVFDRHVIPPVDFADLEMIDNGPIKFKNEPRGPTTIKSLYTGIPNYYPYIRKVTPVNTMYGIDSSARNGHGYLQNYQTMLYPRTGYSPKEYRNYVPDYLPVPDIRNWTKHRIITGVNAAGHSFSPN